MITLFVFLFSGFAKSGELPPVGFMEPKAWKILSEYYQSLNNNSS